MYMYPIHAHCIKHVVLTVQRKSNLGNPQWHEYRGIGLVHYCQNQNC